MAHELYYFYSIRKQDKIYDKRGEEKWVMSYRRAR